MRTIFWYDLETSGVDPIRDHIVQFAGVRTDLNLTQVGPPVEAYCQFPEDALPDPDSCLITGWSPSRTPDNALSEPQMMAVIEREFFTPGTCVAGYGSSIFDDEFVRSGLFRNFYDAEAWRRRDGSMRWDLVDTVRTIAALRPGRIRWPRHRSKSKAISFRLSDLTRINRIAHGKAHDALSDVLATVALARLLRQQAPELFSDQLHQSGEGQVRSVMGEPLETAFLHVSSEYSAQTHRLRPVTSLGALDHDPNCLIALDLMASPEWLDAEDEQILETVRLPLRAAQTQSFRVPLKVVRVTRCPSVLPLAALHEDSPAATQVNLERTHHHLEHYQRLGSPFLKRVQSFFSPQPAAEDPDPEVRLAAGSAMNASEWQHWTKLRALSPEQLADCAPAFDNPALSDALCAMLLRYRARNFPETLTDAEREAWSKDIALRLQSQADQTPKGHPISRIEKRLRRIKRLLHLHQENKRRVSLLQDVLRRATSLRTQL